MPEDSIAGAYLLASKLHILLNLLENVKQILEEKSYNMCCSWNLIASSHDQFQHASAHPHSQPLLLVQRTHATHCS